MALHLKIKEIQQMAASWWKKSAHATDAGDGAQSGYESSRHVPRGTPACLAPWVSVNFTIDGNATACCLNRKTSVRVAGKSIDEIWLSDAFVQLREKVKSGDLGYDCSICRQQIDSGNYSGAKSLHYDSFYPEQGHPKVMEFCMENTCNLACVMCNSMLSSTIRKNQKLPPFKTKYDERFMEQLDAYIPQLQSAVFSGGEPFLIPVYYRIWEKMIRLNPELVISVVTNGTTLDDKVKNLLERGRFKINVSLDSVDKQTYEAIRVNSNLDLVLENFEWFRSYGILKNLPVNIPVCSLTLNWQTIPDVVRFANKKNVSMNFVYVDRPLSLSLVNKEPAYLEQVISYFESQRFEESTECANKNSRMFQGLIRDLKTWKAQNLNKAEAEEQKIDTDNYIETLQAIVAGSSEPEITQSEAIREDLLCKLTEVLDNVPANKRADVFERITHVPLTVIYDHVKGKNTRELIVLFNEYTGA